MANSKSRLTTKALLKKSDANSLIFRKKIDIPETISGRNFYKQGVSVDIKGARKIIRERTEFQNGIAYPLYSDISGVKFFEREARDFFANEGTTLIKCVAVIVESPASKLMADFYISVNKPAVPTRIFFDKEDAVEYLRQFATGVKA